MAGDDSEEKNLPASQKKLRDARKKGQVPKSKDLTSGFALAGCLGVLLAGSGGILSLAATTLDSASRLAAGDFHVGLAGLSPVVVHAFEQALLPMLLASPTLVILSSMVAMRGIPFAMDPVVPKLEKINPAEGFKKLFQLRSLVELLKTLVKTTVIVAVFIAVLLGGIRALTLAPACGLDCEVGLFGQLARPLLAAAALLFLLAGAADFGLQRWLFLRDQKMSITEQKRERKDMDGDPHVKSERRRLMREALHMAGGLGIKRATLVILGADGALVGLRYKIEEMPAPVVVCRGRGDRGRALLTEAITQRLAAAQDADLADELFRVPLGHGIPEKLFRPMALAMRNAGSA